MLPSTFRVKLRNMTFKASRPAALLTVLIICFLGEVHCSSPHQTAEREQVEGSSRLSIDNRIECYPFSKYEATLAAINSSNTILQMKGA